MDDLTLSIAVFFSAALGSLAASAATRRSRRDELIKLQHESFQAADKIIVATMRLTNIADLIDRLLIVQPELSNQEIANAVIENTEDISLDERELVNSEVVDRARTLMARALDARGLSDIVERLVNGDRFRLVSGFETPMSIEVKISSDKILEILKLQPARAFSLFDMLRLSTALGWPGKTNFLLVDEAAQLLRAAGPPSEESAALLATKLINQAIADRPARSQVAGV